VQAAGPGWYKQQAQPGPAGWACCLPFLFARGKPNPALLLAVPICIVFREHTLFVF